MTKYSCCLDEFFQLTRKKNNEKQTGMCFEIFHDKNWQTFFDQGCLPSSFYDFLIGYKEVTFMDFYNPDEYFETDDMYRQTMFFPWWFWWMPVFPPRPPMPGPRPPHGPRPPMPGPRPPHGPRPPRPREYDENMM